MCVCVRFSFASLYGCGSKLNHHKKNAGFSPCLHLLGFRFGYTFLTQSHVCLCVCLSFVSLENDISKGTPDEMSCRRCLTFDGLIQMSW